MTGEFYANGQRAFKADGNKMTYFFRNGRIRAEGLLENGVMEGAWRFYRDSGLLWQIGSFVNGNKDGVWTRYDKIGELEDEETFRNDRKLKSRV